MLIYNHYFGRNSDIYTLKSIEAIVAQNL
jgi:hypothetical protein